MVRSEKAAVLAVLLAGAAGVLLAQDEAWTPDGLEDMRVRAMTAGPLGERYAATDTGVFRSTEPGVWTEIAYSPRYADVLALDPANPDVVYAAGGWGVHRSADAGQHFQRLTGAPIGILALAIDPVQPQTVYVGGQSGISRTTDGGATWSERADGNLVGRIAALVVDPTRPGTAYAGADQGDSYSYSYYDPPDRPVRRSIDSGDSWKPVLRSADSLSAKALAVDAQTGVVYAAIWYREHQAGLVYRSADAGATWTGFPLGQDVYVTALLDDPTNADVIYAATTGDVLRSVDGGGTWAPIAPGLPTARITSLAFDSSDGMLRAGTDRGAFAIRITPALPVCAPVANVLCLLGARYRVDLAAENPRTGRSAAGVAIRGGDRFGSFSLPAFTGDATLPEVFVKMLNPPGSPLWVFYGGLTSLPYTLTVTDMFTGLTETYVNTPENRFCGGVDGSAFSGGGDSCAGCWDYVQSAGRAETANGAVSLLAGRFSITLSAFSSRHNRTEPGVAVAKTDRYGYFTLPGFTGDASFPEVHVKMVDFRSITGDFLLFYTGLTSLDYTLTVTDTVTGTVQTFESTGDYCGAVETLPPGPQ